MGRAGIRRRKRKNLHTDERYSAEPGVGADLNDQAEWSSYTQDVPRLGDERRERIRLARYARAANAARRGDALGDYQWTAIWATLGLSAAIGGAIWGLVLVIRWLA